MKQNKKFAILLISLAAVGIFAVSAGVNAQAGVVKCADGTPVNAEEKCPIQNPAKQYLVDYADFGTLLVKVIEIALYFAGAIALLFLIIGGFQYIAARGNEETTEKAKKTISGAIIGIVIIIMSYAIISIINNLVVKGPGP